MVKDRQPNTICRNPNCTKGENGGRKKFYACLTCLRTQSWKAYCCCAECHDEYTKIVLDSRSKGLANKIETTPERIDMSSEQIHQIMETPVDKIEEYTRTVELADYFEETPDASIADIVEDINNRLDFKSKRKNKRNKI